MIFSQYYSLTFIITDKKRVFSQIVTPLKGMLLLSEAGLYFNIPLFHHGESKTGVVFIFPAGTLWASSS